MRTPMSRRTLATGAAWSLPAIAVAANAPLVAASPCTPIPLSVTSDVGTQDSTGSEQPTTTWLLTNNGTAAIPAGAAIALRTYMQMISTVPVPQTWTTLSVTVVAGPAATYSTGQYSAPYIASPAGTPTNRLRSQTDRSDSVTLQQTLLPGETLRLEVVYDQDVNGVVDTQHIAIDGPCGYRLTVEKSYGGRD